ncbi:MAG: tetratricopeptide repeat protein [Cyanobacteria bacterium J06621_11]
MRALVITATTLVFFTPLPVQSQTNNLKNQSNHQSNSQIGHQSNSQIGHQSDSQIGHQPSNRTLLQQGIAAQTMGNYIQAEIAYREAIRLNSKDPIAYYNLGNVLAEQSKVIEAIAAYQTAITLAPTNAKANYNLGYWLSSQGETESAIAAYRTRYSQIWCTRQT